MGKAQVQGWGDRQTCQYHTKKDKPISQMGKIYNYQQPVPKLKNAYCLEYFCGSVGDENLTFGLSII